MRPFLTVLLLLAAGSASAQWFKYATLDDITFYIDTDTIAVKGDLRNVTEIQDLAHRDNSGALSYRLLNEYDCKQKRLRHVSRRPYSENMGKGTAVVIRDFQGEWQRIVPGTIAEFALQKIVCGK